MMQLLAPAFDSTLVGELAQHALELNTAGILQTEGARDLAGPDFALSRADEGKKLLLRRKSGTMFAGMFDQRNVQAETLTAFKVRIAVPFRYSAACPPIFFLAFGVVVAVLAGLAGALRAGVRRRDDFPPRSALASIRPIASSSVTVSAVLSCGSVAFTPSWLT